MNIAIVGLGLIGGSFAKSISKFTTHKVFAISHNSESISSATRDGSIVRCITPSELSDMDMTIICLPPTKIIEFIEDNVHNFKQGSIVSDVSGVKTAVASKVEKILRDSSVNYISIHPMAGRECSGYKSALANLFIGRSLIIIDNGYIGRDVIDIVENLGRNIGFEHIVYTTKEKHDRIIAYTSQMCHITSNAFVKSPTSREHLGFSGGSFEDLTRVAFLDPKLWIELFSMNRDALLIELNLYIEELKKYQQAIANEDYDSLYALLKEGRDIKESITK